MQLWQHLSDKISLHTQTDFNICSHHSLGGGCINDAYKVSDEKSSYFVKANHLKYADMFETEALALDEIASSETILVPRPVCTGQTDSQSYLVLNWLDLSGQIDSHMLGQQLAAMHRISGKQFGWHRQNTIGATPQANTLTNNWIDFWRDQRLLPQLRLAQDNGYGKTLSPVVEKLLSRFECLFEHYQPVPSLLHGDLWGGNAAALKNGIPVVFDPAIYYGDRETDLAMTHLFGGFSPDFYRAYNETWPLDEGFEVRKTFYNLYHIINHLNLFGTGYLGQAVSMTEKVLAQT